MQDMGLRQPLLCEGVQARPGHPVALTPSTQYLVPIPHDGVAEYCEQTASALLGRSRHCPARLYSLTSPPPFCPMYRRCLDAPTVVSSALTSNSRSSHRARCVPWSLL